MNNYRLPELPYDYSALEPAISAQVLELHHGKHHATYVKKANETLEQLKQARVKEEFTHIGALERALAFNVSGHVLHSLFWKNLAPKSGGRPEGALLEGLTRDFGSFEAFKKQVVETANSVMGSGWAALVWEPVGKQLLVTQLYDHQSNVTEGSQPLMVLDAWEHAYYLQYQNRKTEFFEAVWNLWNWKDIAQRYDAVARK